MKKVISLLTAVLLIAAAVSVWAFTVSADTSGYYTYSVSNGEATITDVKTSISGDITVPSTLGGYPVTSIGRDAFDGCSGLTSISIPNSVTSIGDYAFYGCSSLTGISIPDGVTSIGSYAFRYCSSLTSVIIGDGVTNIGDYAFSDCRSLKIVVIPESVMRIETYAFYRCSPTVVYYTGSGTDREKIHIGSYNNELNNATWHYNSVLIADDVFTSVVLNGEVTIINVDKNISGGMTVPSTLGSYPVTSIGRDAFCNCSSLTSISIPDSVASIGRDAFSGCSSLTGISIPNSVTSIGDYAFDGCSGLTGISIPNSVTSIGSSAFNYCNKIKKITLPFVGATLNGTDNNHFGYIFGASDCSENQMYVPASLKTVVITGGNLIDERAFYQCSKIEEVIITENVREISYYAFEYCTELKAIYIPKCVLNLNYSRIFDKCNQLTIYCSKNSQAHNYAQSWGIPFKTVTSYQDQFGAIYGGTFGDLNGDESVTDADAVYLLYYTFLPDMYPVNQDCDFNGDGQVNDKDAVYLLYHTFLPDLYPIKGSVKLK